MTPLMYLRCAWCSRLLGFKSCAWPMLGVTSHGICPACAGDYFRAPAQDAVIPATHTGRLLRGGGKVGSNPVRPGVVD